MADYKQSTVSGSSFQRACDVIIRNPLNGAKTISFTEEKVFTVGGETFTAAVPNLFGGLQREFTPENAATTFPLRDINGDPTGATATYTDVYLTLMSLYYALAAERDAQ